jgi:hypothetical protein
MSQKTTSVPVCDVLQFIPQVARISQDYRIEMLKSNMKLCGDKSLNIGLKIDSFLTKIYSLQSAFLPAVQTKEIPN